MLISCEKSLEADRASFISIDQFTYLSNNKSEQIPFSDQYQSTKITDCWVTLNGLFLGAFEMPSSIPVLFDGEVDARLSPGIKVNGISSNRIIYPFYKEYEISTELNFDQNVILNPTTEYKENTEFQLLVDFELLGDIFEATDTILPIPFTQTEEVFQGQKSCAICVNNENPYFQIQNTVDFSFDNPFETIFVELDFKASIPFSIGIVTDDNLNTRQEHMIIFSSDSWKKLYLDISPLIGTGNSEYKIYFEGTLPSELDSGCVFLDNIKIVH
jgi:hypothetical protein